MHAVQALAVLAFAGQTLAAPWSWPAGFWGTGSNNGGSNNVAQDVAVVTAYTTVTMGGDFRPAATPVAEQPQVTYAVAKPTASASTPSTPSSGNSNTGYMAVVSEWRSKMGMSALSQDSKLEGNALKTAQDGKGEMVHELNSGTMAQVLAPGDANEFEHVFVGGWLCEVPSLPGLNGICSTQSNGWTYGGQTGHADILSSSSYSKIGCALAGGIWACDLA